MFAIGPNSKAPQIAALIARYAVPSIFELREFVAAGGLMSYGSDITDRIGSLASTSGVS